MDRIQKFFDTYIDLSKVVAIYEAESPSAHFFFGHIEVSGQFMNNPLIIPSGKWKQAKERETDTVLGLVDLYEAEKERLILTWKEYENGRK